MHMNLGILDIVTKGGTIKMGPEFFQTGMGRTYYEHTMPMLVKQLELLNQNLMTLNDLIQHNTDIDEEHLQQKRVRVINDIPAF